MNSQQLLYINIGIGLFFGLYFFLFRPKPKQPTRLNLRGLSGDHPGDHPGGQSTSAAGASEELTVELTEKHARDEKVARVLESWPRESQNIESPPPFQTPPATPTIEIPAPVEMKKNETYFVYNAHEWESHDVLGLPRNCTLREATEKYQQLIKTSESSTFEFYEAAYSALLKKKVAR